MPTVSVIVPVYNVEKYIHRCVDSILAQTFTDFELILVDDGSPDNCGMICDEYAAIDSRIRMIHQTNQGQAAARNRGVVAAESNWICFVDADDVIHPQMIEKLYRAAVDNHVKLSMCGSVESEELPEYFHKKVSCSFSVLKMDEDGLVDMWKNGGQRYYVVWGKLICKSIVQAIPFAEGRIYEDIVACQWMERANYVTNCEAKLYFYQTNPQGTTKTQFTEKNLDAIWATNELLSFYKKRGFQKLYAGYITRYLYDLAYLYSQAKEIKNAAALRIIKTEFHRVAYTNWKEADLTAEQKEYILGSFYPRATYLRSVARRIFIKQ